MSEFIGWGKMNKCPICGKEFLVTCNEKSWAYRAQGKEQRLYLYCSWHCYRERIKRKKTRALTAEYHSYYTVHEAAEKLKTSDSAIRRCIESGTLRGKRLRFREQYQWGVLKEDVENYALGSD